MITQNQKITLYILAKNLHLYLFLYKCFKHCRMNQPKDEMQCRFSSDLHEVISHCQATNNGKRGSEKYTNEHLQWNSPNDSLRAWVYFPSNMAWFAVVCTVINSLILLVHCRKTWFTSCAIKWWVRLNHILISIARMQNWRWPQCVFDIELTKSILKNKILYCVSRKVDAKSWNFPASFRIGWLNSGASDTTTNELLVLCYCKF